MYLISNQWSKESPYYFYKTTNLINNKFYYGSGSEKTYIGSGTAFENAVKKYGKKNFKHERLRFFKTRSDAYAYEDRFLKLFRISKIKESYNLKDEALGLSNGMGIYIDCNGNSLICSKEYAISNKLDHICKDMIISKDINGKTAYVTKTEFYSGNYVGINKGKTSVINEQGNTESISINDDRYINGNVKHVSYNKTVAIDENGQISYITRSEFNDGNYHGNRKGFVSVKDENGNTKSIHKDDPDYISGKYKHIFTGLISVIDSNGNSLKVTRDEFESRSDLFGQTKGVWGWRKSIEIDYKIHNVKYWKEFYGLDKLYQLKDHLINNNIDFKII